MTTTIDQTAGMQIRTFDDLHESEQKLLMEWAADNLPTLLAANGQLGWYTNAERQERRTQALLYDRATSLAVRRAVRLLELTPPRKLSKGESADALAVVLKFANAVLDKVRAEDTTGLEQFGPLKRAANEAVGY